MSHVEESVDRIFNSLTDRQKGDLASLEINGAVINKIYYTSSKELYYELAFPRSLGDGETIMILDETASKGAYKPDMWWVSVPDSERFKKINEKAKRGDGTVMEVKESLEGWGFKVQLETNAKNLGTNLLVQFPGTGEVFKPHLILKSDRFFGAAGWEVVR